MKKTFFLSFIIVFTLFAACKKDTKNEIVKANDFRDNFAGNYLAQKCHDISLPGFYSEVCDSNKITIAILKSQTDSGLVFNNDTLYMDKTYNSVNYFIAKNTNSTSHHWLQFEKTDSVVIVFREDSTVGATGTIWYGEKLK